MRPSNIHVAKTVCLWAIWLLPCLVDGAAKGNVLLFFVDDGGFMQSSYNNTVCKTPNLDKLASQSVIFRNGYTSVSSCSPSRSVLLTGLPQHQNGMYGLKHSVHHFQSFDNVHSLPVILSQHNIRTGLIGKKHLGPESVYTFDYERSENQYNQDQIGRNITFMKQFVREFLSQKDDRPFFLYIAFYDTHRGNGSNQSYFGPFMNNWGNGQPGMGVIQDWKPETYDPASVVVPYFLPDTPATRQDIAAMYTSFNRMDQGVGLFLQELKDAGHLEDTLILFTADNGIPFPNAKTNLYEPGMGEPMMMSSPFHKDNWGKFSHALASTMDFAPTILDWFNISYPQYMLNGGRVSLTGRSLLPLAADPAASGFTHVFSSHNFHEVTMAYPMRVIVNQQYRLIHNINHGAPYPLATDLYNSWTFQDILNRTKSGQPTHWFKGLRQYYYRDEWELFDLENDPQELKNRAYDSGYSQVFKQLNQTLAQWLQATGDPWRCMPHSVLFDDQCYPMYNEI
ncbi:unnamed protein product [Candidula unifasciata]|uniref:N-sulfoglucosamine sulfohydrolase n=1 Tax=Candidula unifasciata TaxID=100452 RepID=A0A8S3Z060_9EUPU|nr:unnamed protein product [Candidula unifasciata]